MTKAFYQYIHKDGPIVYGECLLSKAEHYSGGYYTGLAPEPRFDRVLKIARRVQGKQLLDIGCGDGCFTVLLGEALHSSEAAAIEVSAQAVLEARKRGIKAVRLDIDEQDLPFSPEYFDFIYCGEIIEHLFNPDHLLAEVYRVLKGQGTAVFTTPNLAGWANRLALLLGYQPYPTAVSPSHEGTGKLILRGGEGQWGHIRVFTLRALTELLSIHHFKIVSLSGCPVSVKSSSSRGLASLIVNMDHLISVLPGLSSRVIAVVEKEIR
jgi:methionine biosynthesis protein MetW